jgi:two-component system, NarL family, invasion response regulator UvrY
MNILIADDHPMIQKGLAYLIKDALPGVFIKSVFNGEQAGVELGRKQYDLLILDINMPLMSFQQFEHLLRSYPQVPILMYSQNSEEQHALRYLKEGAAGYVEKSAEDDVLLSAIRKILKGDRYFSQKVLSLMLERLQGKNNNNPFDLLSNREYDVALLMLKGIGMSEIGDQLHLSPSTVSTYKSRLFEKLKVRNNVEFIELAKLHQLQQG